MIDNEQSFENNRNITLSSKSPENSPRSQRSPRSPRSPRRQKINPTVLNTLLKGKITRNKNDIKIISDYLGDNIDYFKKLKEKDELYKLQKLAGVVTIEKYKAKEQALKFDQKLDKLYILMTGRVSLYKKTIDYPVLTLEEYIEYMKKVFYEESDIEKYNRLKTINKRYSFDVDSLIDNFPAKMKRPNKYKFTLEIDEKLGEYTSDFVFGEAEINNGDKVSKSIYTLKVEERTLMLLIEKEDYLKINKELEDKKYETSLFQFIKYFPVFFKCSQTALIKFISQVETITLTKGEFLYKQNEESNYIYFLKEGKLEMYSLISLKWISKYLHYLKNENFNLFSFFENDMELKDENIIDKFIRQKQLNEGKITSPCKYMPSRFNCIITSLDDENSKTNVKNEIVSTIIEEENKEPTKLFKILIKNINEVDILGMEDALELKKRFCYVKCVSPNAELLKVEVSHFVRLLFYYTNKFKDKNLMAKSYFEKKSTLFKRILFGTERLINKSNKNFQEILNRFLKYEHQYVDGEDCKENFNEIQESDSKKENEKGLKVHGKRHRKNLSSNCKNFINSDTKEQIKRKKDLEEVMKKKTKNLFNFKIIHMNNVKNLKLKSISNSTIKNIKKIFSSPLSKQTTSKLEQSTVDLNVSKSKNNKLVITENDFAQTNFQTTPSTNKSKLLPSLLNSTKFYDKNKLDNGYNTINQVSNFRLKPQNSINSSITNLDKFSVVVCKAAGIKRKIQEKEIFYNVYDEEDQNVIQIKSDFKYNDSTRYTSPDATNSTKIYYNKAVQHTGTRTHRNTKSMGYYPFFPNVKIQFSAAYSNKFRKKFGCF